MAMSSASSRPGEVGKEGVSARHMKVLCGREWQGERERVENRGSREEM